ncbi:hypothetical protein FOMPIDRAFT_1052529 [Fomitopsis schrenkii]|uniref:Uncharacterized protein n=1 Tax=Fomitopsis schrenkii TaxID=2126942 RepID=S8DVZ6_FOMSC|nr:hypothetical protein FOMPIDRAFT_1052529 [Fomitopsis schrenkii]
MPTAVYPPSVDANKALGLKAPALKTGVQKCPHFHKVAGAALVYSHLGSSAPASLQQQALSTHVSLNEVDRDALRVSADLQLPAPSIILPRLPRLSTLRLYSSAFCFINSVEAVTRNFVASPQLCELDIGGVAYDDIDFENAPAAAQSEQAAGITPVIHISQLKRDYHSCLDDLYLDWISSPWVLLDLRNLDVSLNPNSMLAPRFVDLVNGTGCSLLEELSVATIGNQHNDNGLPILDILRQYLRSLCVSSSAPTFHVIVRLLSSYSGNGLRKLYIGLSMAFGPRTFQWASFHKRLDTLAESLIAISRRCACLQGPSITMDLHLESLESSTDLEMHDTARRMLDRIVPLVTAAAMDIVFVVNETTYSTGPKAKPSVKSTTERYAATSRRTPRPSPSTA